MKTPGIGANMGNFRGNLKSTRALKGGGSISGPWNNANRPVNVQAPGFGAKFVDQYQGFIRRRGPKAFDQEGLSFSGSIRTRRSAKGGGSISGKLWNNSNRPIIVRSPGIGAKYIGSYRGFAKKFELSPGYGYQGETYKGSIKARRPEKGGGSISGKLWNNDEKPILVKAPGLVIAKEVGYSGRIRLPFLRKKYIKNPNQDKDALKKIRPDKTTYEVAGLQIKVKQKDYEHNKLAAKGSQKGVAPGKNSVKAAEYSGHLKMLWAYKHNPASNDHALKTIKPTQSFIKGNEYAGGLKMKKYIHNPNSNKNALDVLSPGRAMARIKDYQGNLKMSKPNGKNLHPDAQFAHGFRGNVKQDRTFLMNIKLKWAKLFKKNATQPAVVKEKVRRPRYDKKERDLWKDLYD